jgi:hypothetical protein
VHIQEAVKMNRKAMNCSVALAVAVLLTHGPLQAGIWDLAEFDSLISGPRTMKTGDRSLDLDNLGTLHACWATERAGGGFMFYYSQKPAGGEWSTPGLVLDSSATRYNPVIAVKVSNGDVFIAYNQDEEVYYAENATGAWVEHRLTDNEVDDHDPDIAIDRNGCLHLAWVTVDAYEQYKIAYGTDAGGDWQNQILEDSYIGDYGLGADPVVAVEPEGKAHIAYRGGNYGTYHIHHAENEQPGGTSWDIQFLSSPNSEDLVADIAVMPYGELHLALAGRDDWFAPSRGYYLHRPTGSHDWETAQAVAPTYELTNPKTDADSGDNVHIVWEVLSGNILLGIFAYSENSTGSWLTDHLLGEGEACNPSFLIDDCDQGQLFYYTWENRIYGIAHYGSPILLSPIVISLRPHDDTVSAGGSLAYTGVGTNTTGQQVWFDYWAKVELPSGHLVDPVFGPRHLRLPANKTDSIVVRQRVPRMAPEGRYVYTGLVGEYPDQVWHSDCFEFTVISTSQGAFTGASQWQVLGYEGFGLEDESSLPLTSALHQNHPNPFNATTAINYELASRAHVRLEVYDILGQKVATLTEGQREPGYHAVKWDAAGLPSGVYFCRLTTTGLTDTRRLVLIK